VNNGSSTPPFGYRRWVLLFCAIALGAYHIFTSTLMYPVPGGDATVFMPAAINLKAGRGLTNSLWEMYPDSTGQHRYLEHPPLFQMVVSACMWKTETKNAFLVLAIFNALTLLLYAAFLCTAEFTRHLIASTAGFVALVSSMFPLAFLIFINAGRPEALSTLILCLGIGVATRLPQKCWPVCFGIAIGFVAAIHPAHGIFIACLAALVFFFTATVSQAIRRMMLALVIALPLFWILLGLSPYPIGETLRAISRHAAIANAPDEGITVAAFYFRLAPWSGFYLLGLALVLVWGGIYSWRGGKDRISSSARLATLVVSAFVFWFFSIRRPNAGYYLMMLAPALAATALYLLTVRSRRLPSFPFWIVTVFFSIFSLCLARDIALFVNYRTEGVSFTDAQKDFDQLARSTDKVISVSESFWVLANEFDRISVVERGIPSGDVIVLQQTQRGLLSPPVVPGYRLLSHRFISHPPKWFGLPIARTMPGYAFAIFTREVSLGENRP
jgi:hypothetical protein